MQSFEKFSTKLFMTDPQFSAVSKLPPSWKVSTVGEIGSYMNGYAFKSEQWSKAGDPIIRIQNLNDHKKPFNYFSGDADNKYRVKNGDILISWSASLGTYRWDRGNAWLNQHIFKALPNAEKVSDEFFYWIMLHAIEEIAGAAQGSTMKHVTGKEFRAFNVLLPPADEQAKISQVLAAVQRAIEAQEKIIQTTTELRTNLMQKLFAEGLHGEPQKETKRGPVPERWTVDRFDAFCVLQRGFDITKKQQVPGVVPVVSSGGVSSYHNKAKVPGPGVVIGRKGSLGTVHYIEEDFWPHDTTLWVKDFKGNNPRFTSYFLETLNLKSFDTGAANPTLNRNIVHAETVAFPSAAEQEQIAKALASIEQKGAVHEQKKAALTGLLKSMLTELMNAKTRVHEIDISPKGVVAC
jgi:type I restriction enzyme S subunit